MLLSPKETIILQLLVNHGELFGLALVAKSEGELKRGTVYVTLDRMEDKGYVSSRAEERPEGAAGLPKRLYKPTGLGQRTLAATEVARASLLDGLVTT